MKDLLKILAIMAFSAMIYRCEEPAINDAAAAEVISLEEQAAEIMKWWPGTYNNTKQVEDVVKDGGEIWKLDDSGEGGYLHVQSHYMKLDRPDIGEHVLYLEEYRDLKPDATYRQRIYKIYTDSSSVRVKMYPFKNKKKYVGAWKNPEMLADLSIDSISAYPDFCDLLVTKEGNAYSMKMKDKECAFGTKFFNYEVKLTEDVFSYRDKISSVETDSMLTSAADFAYHHLDRVKL